MNPSYILGFGRVVLHEKCCKHRAEIMSTINPLCLIMFMAGLLQVHK